MAVRPSDAELEAMIGYIFFDKDLLRTALTHPSAVNEPPHKGRAANGRLEFLGDAVLGLVVAEMAYARDSKLNEGALTEARKVEVKNERIRGLAASIGLGPWLYLGGAENNDLGRGEAKRLGDALEAIIGAVYLDAGPTHATRVVRRMLERFPAREAGVST